MLNPSYSSLMDILNKDAEATQKISSRYSIVIAASKRARQIVAGAQFEDMNLDTDKAVSIAVNEIYHGHVRVVPSDTPWEDDLVVQNLPTLIDDSFVMADSDLGGFEAKEFSADDDMDDNDGDDDDWLDDDENYEDGDDD
ncbi:MAG: DNA-directed RNA polymerase subunit omega [Defluviitaleaceae bacterium]|nr:DNA-directed RNA polymerase subunit omega [Defluviitaleaceae bacterium]